MVRVMLAVFLIWGSGCRPSPLGEETTWGNDKEHSPNLAAKSSVHADSLIRIQNAQAMEHVAGASYRPFYGKDSALVYVDAFEMDALPVTNAQFLRFVHLHPEWRKSAVTQLVADETYLSHWKADEALMPNVSPDAPVTNVSWFAAKSYCACMDKRLPSIDEWERAGMADATSEDARRKPEYYRALLAWYEKPVPTSLPAVGQNPSNIWGIQDLHGLVWEWTSDFNSVMISGESRKDAKVDDRGLFCSGGAVGVNDLTNYAAFMRFAFRGSLKARYTLRNLGFRCARSIVPDML